MFIDNIIAFLNMCVTT